MPRELLLIGLLSAALGHAAALPPVRDGDVVFHTSRSSQSIAIQRATGSRYSHMGIVFHRGGRAYVLEAVATVRYTPLSQWLARGVGGHFVIKRLNNAATVLNAGSVRDSAREGRGIPGPSLRSRVRVV
jgi:Permuted papain-like amidase enzyme, YaeF/YiiX, C92 family